MHRLSLEVTGFKLEIESDKQVSIEYIESVFSVFKERNLIGGGPLLDGLPTDDATFHGSGLDISLNTLITKTGDKTLRGVLETTSYFLAANSGDGTFSKEALLESAAGAHAWQKKYTKNRLSTLTRIMESGDLLERADGSLMLSDGFRQEMSGKIDG